MERDRFGLELSTSSAEAAARYISFVDEMVGGSAGGPSFVQAAIDADGEWALPLADQAYLAFLLGDLATARQRAGRALELSTSSTPRERSHIVALTEVVAGDPAQA